MKYKRLRKFALLTIIVLLLVISSLPARVIGSSTITLYGYIAPRINVVVSQTGEISFTSNTPDALLDITHWQESTLLSVTAL